MKVFIVDFHYLNLSNIKLIESLLTLFDDDPIELRVARIDELTELTENIYEQTLTEICQQFSLNSLTISFHSEGSRYTPPPDNDLTIIFSRHFNDITQTPFYDDYIHEKHAYGHGLVLIHDTPPQILIEKTSNNQSVKDIIDAFKVNFKPDDYMERFNSPLQVFENENGISTQSTPEIYTDKGFDEALDSPSEEEIVESFHILLDEELNNALMKAESDSTDLFQSVQSETNRDDKVGAIIFHDESLMEEKTDNEKYVMSSKSQNIKSATTGDKVFFKRTTNAEEEMFDDVYFTAFYPNTVVNNAQAEKDNSYTVLVYAHLAEFIKKIESDAKTFSSKFGDKGMGSTTLDSHSLIKKGTPITVELEAHDIDFTISSMTEKWDDEYTRYEFSFNSNTIVPSDNITVQVLIKVEGIEIGRINFSINVSNEDINDLSITSNATSTMYKNIFLSYSEKDSCVVYLYKKFSALFNENSFIHTPSENKATLKNAIQNSDIFHLFWSNNSANDEIVMTSLDLAVNWSQESNNNEFITPHFWKTPIEPDPPENLKSSTFKYIPMDDTKKEILKMAHKTEKKLAAVFGFVFISLILIIALLVDNPTDFQIFVFRTVLALAAAGVGAVIPGFIHLDLSVSNNNKLRAGGAIALFAIVFYTNPPEMIKNSVTSEQISTQSD
jgi:hypothetical protein